MSPRLSAPATVRFVQETIADAANDGDLQAMRCIALRLANRGYDANVVPATMVRLALDAAVEANVMVVVAETKAVSYRRVRHAAHAEGGGGWDLEEWTIRSEDRPETARAGTAVPPDAEYHHGFVNDGLQHWVFSRRASFTPNDTCSICRARAAKKPVEA